MVIPIVISELGTIPNGLLGGLEELEIGGRAETIQTTENVLQILQTVPHNFFYTIYVTYAVCQRGLLVNNQ